MGHEQSSLNVVIKKVVQQYVEGLFYKENYKNISNDVVAILLRLNIKIYLAVSCTYVWSFEHHLKFSVDSYIKGEVYS